MDAYPPWPIVFSAALVLAAAGCTSRPLSREVQNEAVLEKNRRLEADLLAARRRLADLEAQRAAPAAPAPAPPQDPFRAVAVRFGRFTGGLDMDGKPGCERLKVVLEPLDAEGDVVKRAGALDLALLEVRGKDARVLARWTWTAEDLARAWLSGFGTYGYVLKLDWPEGPPPASPGRSPAAPGRSPARARLLVRAAFTTPAGETFTAEKAFTLD
jgi:hypothetical protein